MESLLCRDNEVIVVGGGNSAGQAAMFLSGIAKHVYHIIRGESLATSMSQYLVSRIENSSRITLSPTVRSRNSKANHPWSASHGQIASQGSG